MTKALNCGKGIGTDKLRRKKGKKKRKERKRKWRRKEEVTVNTWLIMC